MKRSPVRQVMRQPVDLIDIDNQAELRQLDRKLHLPVGQGKDDHGDFLMIPLSMVRGGATRPFKVHTSPIKHIMLDQAQPPRGWYKPKYTRRRVRNRPCYTEAIITAPYGGFCRVNCCHCYINNGVRGYRSTGLPTVDPEYPDKMDKYMKKLMVASAAYMSPFTEPFMPVMEDEYSITERLTQVFVDEGIPIYYLSRCIPPDWAMEALLQNPYSYMQWSITTSNDDHWRRFSPGAFDLDEVYQEIERYSDAGIYISLQIDPIMAGLTTLDEIVTLIENVHWAGAHHVIFKFMESVTMARKVNLQRFRDRGIPNNLVDRLDHNLSQMIGGVWNIAQDIRVEWLKVLLEETRRIGITMTPCFEFYDDGDSGTNLGPYFNTADQCHGRGVPMYYRPEPGAPFEPLPGCYRKGCLYCEDFGTCACNDNRLLEAGALKYTDLRTIRLVGNDEDWSLDDSCVGPEDACLYVDNPPVGNPKLQTDAEMWGWDLDEDIANKRKFPPRDKDGNPLDDVPF